MSVVDLPVLVGQVNSIFSSTMGGHAYTYSNIHDQSVYTTGKTYLAAHVPNLHSPPFIILNTCFTSVHTLFMLWMLWCTDRNGTLVCFLTGALKKCKAVLSLSNMGTLEQSCMMLLNNEISILFHNYSFSLGAKLYCAFL